MKGKTSFDGENMCMVSNSGFWVDVGAGLAKLMVTGLSTSVLCSTRLVLIRGSFSIFLPAIGRERRIREDFFDFDSMIERKKGK